MPILPALPGRQPPSPSCFHRPGFSRPTLLHNTPRWGVPSRSWPPSERAKKYGETPAPPAPPSLRSRTRTIQWPRDQNGRRKTGTLARVDGSPAIWATWQCWLSGRALLVGWDAVPGTELRRAQLVIAGAAAGVVPSSQLAGAVLVIAPHCLWPRCSPPLKRKAEI